MADDSAVKLMKELTLSEEVFEEQNYRTEELMLQCELLDKAGEYEGMLNCAICRVKKMEPMTIEEEIDQRDMFAVACKKFMHAKLDQWRVLRERRAELQTNSLGTRRDIINDYLKEFNQSILTHLNKVCTIVDDILIPNSSSEANKIFFYKMLADYYRHCVDFHEVNSDEAVNMEYNKAVEEARMNYEYAMQLADNAELHPTDPIYLALVLNFSTYLYDMQNDVMGAIGQAQEAFDDAIDGLEDLDDDHHKEATLLLQLLRDNITMWKYSAAVDGLGGFGGEDTGEGYAGLTTIEPNIEPER
eukprot:TRINITY_DN49295_c0_g2_i2.p1 TRINITY_DN49295_c0_g2~~TRINITY_DN49295_c0_g2_i2.p1  ORF type:complete len:302 (+),score=89.16 TRINITY_DN49295_c0_g2_i2:199-1104(+)